MRSRAQLTSVGHWPGQFGSLQRPRPCPPPARPLHCAASRRRRLRAHLAGLPSLSGTQRSRTRPRPQPGPDSPAREGSAPSRSQPVRPQASQLDAGTHPRPRARTARAPPALAARARAPDTPTGGTHWALNKCWSDSSHTCAFEPDRVVTPPSPHP